MRTVIVVAVLALCVGCVGTNAIRISTVPNAAKVYANGRYLGEAPVSVPSKWWAGPFYQGGDTVSVRLEKQGYRVFEKNVPWSELYHRYYQNDFTGGSEFGWGHTFPYTFHLETSE